ncbi:MAG: polymer-forming cytoskeletal protein [Chloroflexi bacterium]|nr:polymer-forming cytoskeletal protein [Chloroflexota bacterium]
MRNRRLIIVGASLLILLALAVVAGREVRRMSIINGDNIIFTTDYRQSGTVDDLFVVGQTIVLAPSSRVERDVSLLGDQITVQGRVGGDLTLLGEDLTLAAGSLIEGDAALMGNRITIAGQVRGILQVTGDSLTIRPDAQIDGMIMACVATLRDERPFETSTACRESEQFVPFARLIALRDGNFAETALRSGVGGADVGWLLATGVFGALGLAALATLAVTIFPQRISRIEQALRQRPGGLSGVGCATLLVATGVTAGIVTLLALVPPLGLILLPVYLVLAFVLLILNVIGLITLALVLGDWLWTRLGRQPAPPLVSAVIGSLALMLVLTLLPLLPFGGLVGLAILTLTSSVGLGAVLFTRIGGHSTQHTYFVQG